MGCSSGAALPLLHPPQASQPTAGRLPTCRPCDSSNHRVAGWESISELHCSPQVWRCGAPAHSQPGPQDPQGCLYKSLLLLCFFKLISKCHTAFPENGVCSVSFFLLLYWKRRVQWIPQAKAAPGTARCQFYGLLGWPAHLRAWSSPTALGRPRDLTSALCLTHPMAHPSWNTLSVGAPEGFSRHSPKLWLVA